jgi:hypothetical protein
MQEISRFRGRPLFALVAEHIDTDVLNSVYEWKREISEAGQGDTLDILIHSPGGQLTACYMIARLFGRYSNDWQALVPDTAASGATLICLGSSNIVMSGIAQLGPIDPQVSSKRREKFFAAERQSPLEAFEALKYLRQFAVSPLDALMEVLTDRGVTPQKALETASTISGALVRPILEKIEPYDLGSFALDNRLALTYCSRIAKPSDSEKRTQRRASHKSLVEFYPAHEFAIDLAEAQSLRLEVSEPSDDIDKSIDKLRGFLPGIKTYVGLVPPVQGGQI